MEGAKVESEEDTGVDIPRQGEVPPLYRVGGATGTHREAYDAEMIAIMKRMHHLVSRHKQGRNFPIFTDSRAAIGRLLHDAVGPGQDVARGHRAGPGTEKTAQHPSLSDGSPATEG